MPGTFVVDRTGIVRYAHRNGHQGDDPDIGMVLDRCKDLPRTAP